MNTKSHPYVLLGALTVAIHLIGFGAVQLGTERLLAQSVSYRDLDLSRPTDAAVLYERIGHAATEVCEAYDGLKASRPALQRTCVERAIAATVARVNAANLTARHQAGYRLPRATQSSVGSAT